MDESKKNGFALGRENYRLLILSAAVIGLGFMLMAGGGSDDPAVFSREIFSPRRITVAPLVVLAGYILVIFAIMKRPRH